MAIVVPVQYQSNCTFIPTPQVDSFNTVCGQTSWNWSFSGGFVDVNEEFSAEDILINLTGFPVSTVFLLKQWSEVPEPMIWTLLIGGLPAVMCRKKN